MNSKSDQVSGKVKQAAGKATGNKKLQAKGNAQEASGKAQDKLKDAGEKVTKKSIKRSKRLARIQPVPSF